MTNWYENFPGYITRAQDERAVALSRAGYQAVIAVEGAAGLLWRATRAGLRRAVDGYTRWNSRRLTVQALSRLDDRMLRDIGVDPGSLEALAGELAERPRRHEPPKSVSRAHLTPALPVLRLSLDCPDLKHAA